MESQHFPQRGLQRQLATIIKSSIPPLFNEINLKELVARKECHKEMMPLAYSCGIFLSHGSKKTTNTKHNDQVKLPPKPSKLHQPSKKSKEELVKKEEDLLARLKPIQDEIRSVRLKRAELRSSKETNEINKDFLYSFAKEIVQKLKGFLKKRSKQ
ncbi:hypothetical protein JHK85_025032 [Glycine max]|nr:hypothetical protein JHK85_025032 [Glycine max]